nr:immunoglobulin heavy chain junction region [Macaca mulatta]MOV47385.1 immunoglobulin heavy chain junction region [Macaca mulatta]MOV47459.1 immunoglobulin heavy chain junction region [Macaca mulatta]MOV47493.1 immunoglobulin heavy chain junction region [Macaca mulatta]MOV47623.1 immunoglobulin heavy chain junction region [Macaca mulatta]
CARDPWYGSNSIDYW